MIRSLSLCTLILWSSLTIFAQKIEPISVSKTQISLNWYENQKNNESVLTFDGAAFVFANGHTYPQYEHSFPVKFTDFDLKINLKNKVFEQISDSEYLTGDTIIKNTIVIHHKIWAEKASSLVQLSFIPLRRNQLTGEIERLVSAQLVVETNAHNIEEKHIALKSLYKEESPLNKGTWYKFKISQSGIYKIDYAQLQEAGIDPSSINPKNIRLFGNGGGMLPEANSAFRYDGLQENAIIVSGEEDGKFDAGDFILFYGKGPHTWSFDENTKRFHHQLNIYDNFAYFFLTIDDEQGKRVQTENSSIEAAEVITDSYDDYLFHESEEYNLIISGRQWFGEQFNATTSRSWDISIPDLISSEQIYLSSLVAARSSSSSSFTYSVSSKELLKQSISAVSSNTNAVYANTSTASSSFTPPGSAFTLDLIYNRPLNSSIGWLDYYEMNYRRKLNYNGVSLLIRDGKGFERNKVQEFRISNAPSDIIIWDISESINASAIKPISASTTTNFRVKNDTTIHEFAVFTSNSAINPTYLGKVANQNLHGIKNTEYIILVYPEFRAYAEELASIHRTERPELNIRILEPQQIYNEYSSGAQDVTAIRDFMRQLSLKSDDGSGPLYLLLFGDASYDFKDIREENSNFVPTWQSPESLHPVYSYATDDYFGLFDENEGQYADGIIDLGIGRFPVQNASQAENAVNKVRVYYSKNEEVLNDWRNVICFVADDEDNNSHIRQANELATFIDTNYQSFMVDKIYLDAYEQVSTPGGQRYPDASTAINERVGRGALIMNYTGHGGELGWAHERVLENSDISSWTNLTHMPLFITATCEFSRYDDPDRAAAGELIFLNENGGGIALYTTSRQTFGATNKALNQAIYDHMFIKTDGKYGALGDVLKNAKRAHGGGENGKKFILLGDPALRLAYPEYNVSITHFNEKAVSEIPDSLSALSVISMKGEVTGLDGNRLDYFNGKVYPLVYDKKSSVITLGQDDKSSPFPFELWKNSLYKGSIAVENGSFEFSFVVPRDISYNYGFGKISLYACNDETDANGYYNNIVVGGFNQNPPFDDTPPTIELFINNEDFQNGGTTNENPILLAYVTDDNGINTVGNGIGHDIAVVLNDENHKTRVINDYYKADLNTFKSGSIIYPMSDLADGPHNLKLTVWDVLNNSSTAETNFVVVRSGSIYIEDLYNAPNPANSFTKFVFEHNQAGNTLDFTLDVYDITGRHVVEIKDQITPSGFRSFSQKWDLKDASGAKLNSGIYVYRLTLSDEIGNMQQKTAKLVITQ